MRCWVWDVGWDGNLTPSDASADTKTTATITDNGAGSYTVAVKNGGAVAGPRTYTDRRRHLRHRNFALARPDSGTGSILVAARLTDNAYAGFVAATTDQGTGPARATSRRASAASSRPHCRLGVVTYGGDDRDASAVGVVVQTADTIPPRLWRCIDRLADFTNGTVNGNIGLNGTTLWPVLPPSPCCYIGFSGTMSTSRATYSSNAVAFNGNIATGNVIGGFYGANGETTAGAFDVQDTGAGGTGAKATGSFLASSVP